MQNLSAKAEPISKLLKKDQISQEEAFQNLKEDIANITRLNHYEANVKTILTTDACTRGFGGTTWQEDEPGRRGVAFSSRHLNGTEQKYAINELDLLAVKWAAEHFESYLLRRKITIETDRKALLAVLRKHRMHKQYSFRLTRWRNSTINTHPAHIWRSQTTLLEAQQKCRSRQQKTKKNE